MVGVVQWEWSLAMSDRECLSVFLFQIARVMGNALLNEVLEANLSSAKLSPDASMWVVPLKVD